VNVVESIKRRHGLTIVAVDLRATIRHLDRNDVMRKLHAYHVFIQAGIICQGLLQYLAVAHPRLGWNRRNRSGARWSADWGRLCHLDKSVGVPGFTDCNFPGKPFCRESSRLSTLGGIFWGLGLHPQRVVWVSV
jgi:hypothetical protein